MHQRNPPTWIPGALSGESPRSAHFCRIPFRSHPAFGLASARANPESGPQPARDFKPANASEEASCSPCNAAIPAPWKVGFSPRAASATQQRGRRRTRCRSSPVRFPGPGAPRCAPCHPRKTRAPRRAPTGPYTPGRPPCICRSPRDPPGREGHELTVPRTWPVSRSRCGACRRLAVHQVEHDHEDGGKDQPGQHDDGQVAPQ